MTYEEMAKKAKEEGRSRALTITFVPWERVGQNIVGRLVTVTNITSRKTEGTYNQYVFHTEKGMVKFQCGNFFDHEQGMLMSVGGVYEITYCGKKKLPQGNEVNQFETVLISDGDRPAENNSEPELF